MLGAVSACVRVLQRTVRWFVVNKMLVFMIAASCWITPWPLDIARVCSSTWDLYWIVHASRIEAMDARYSDDCKTLPAGASDLRRKSQKSMCEEYDRLALTSTSTEFWTRLADRPRANGDTYVIAACVCAFILWTHYQEKMERADAARVVLNTHLPSRADDLHDIYDARAAYYGRRALGPPRRRRHTLRITEAPAGPAEPEGGATSDEDGPSGHVRFRDDGRSSDARTPMRDVL